MQDEKFKEAMDLAVQITAMKNKFVSVSCDYMSYSAVNQVKVVKLEYRYHVEDSISGHTHTIGELVAILTAHLNDLERWKV